MAYFNNFPKITYNDSTIRNILLKSALVAEVFENQDSFYPYIVKDGYRPDLVANEFYGDSRYDWVVYTSHYEYTGTTGELAEDIARKSWKMSTATHAKKTTYGESTAGWTAVSVYDYEDRLNEERRSIKLLAPAYLNQIEKELATIFS